MPLYSLGDLASSFALRRQNVQLNTELARLTAEMASGVTTDLPRHLNGNYSYLGDLERDLRVNEGYSRAAQDAAIFTEAMQTAMGRVQDTTSALAADLVQSASTSLPETMEAVSQSARGDLDALISTLNTNIAGRALFSGVATDRMSFASADAILSELKTAIAGEATPDGILSAIDDWFDTPGGGFETSGYLGADTAMSPFLIGEGESVDLDLRGDSAAIRDLLKNTAIAALAADESLAYSGTLQAGLLTRAGESLMTAQGALTQLRSDLGYAEGRIEESRTRLSAEKTGLELALGDLVGVDPFETATRLKDVQFQLESLYTVTARLSRLSLVEYL